MSKIRWRFPRQAFVVGVEIGFKSSWIIDNNVFFYQIYPFHLIVRLNGCVLERIYNLLAYIMYSYHSTIILCKPFYYFVLGKVSTIFFYVLIWGTRVYNRTIVWQF